MKINMPAPGAELELNISDLNTDGSAVARLDGLVYFVDAGLPGERALARVESVKKNLVLARRLAVLSPSPGAVEPFCPYFGDCGGCTWQNLAYPAQLAWKHGRVEAALRRIARVELDLPPVIPSPAQRGFRNKMEYAFGQRADGIISLGLRRRASHEVCGFDNPAMPGCPLQSEGAGRVLQSVLSWARLHGLTPWNGKSGALRHFLLRESSDGAAARMAELVCGSEPPGGPLLEDLYAALAPLGVSSFTVSQRKDKSPLALGEKTLRRFGAGSLSERIGHLVLEFPVQGFVQTNAAAAAVLYDEARALAGLTGAEELWDIYAGVGALGLYLADRAGSLVGVELSKDAVKTAEKNAAALGCKHCRFVAGDAARVLPALPGRPHVLVADPPRGGLSARFIPAIKQKAPLRIVYVSCDPATLARDIAALAPKYEAKAVRAVDMFPHTPHVECVALLEPAE